MVSSRRKNQCCLGQSSVKISCPQCWVSKALVGHIRRPRGSFVPGLALSELPQCQLFLEPSMLAIAGPALHVLLIAGRGVPCGHIFRGFFTVAQST
jgi:hypothetical protein